MNTEEIKKKVSWLIEPVVRDCGMEFYDMELKRMKGKFLLRVFIEKSGGVTIDDCEHVSREVEAVLDAEDPIPGSYVLEVSSPGLDRPLKNKKDFRRLEGTKAKVVTSEPIGNGKQTVFVGNIKEAREDRVVLMLPEHKEVVIPYKAISRAKPEVEV